MSESAPSLARAAALLADRQASASELLDDALARIDRFDELVQAWVTLDVEAARRAAVSADEHLAARKRRSAVDGVPIGVKDLIDTAGLQTSYGSPIFADHVPARDAPVVAALRRAGTVIVGKTVTTMFATFDPSVTRNPWNLAHTPGGSSSGSAACVAATMVPGAIGTQTGGSTIRPASYCGVVGYIPSPGWIGRSGIYPCSWSLDRVGLFGTSVADVALLLDASLGRDRDDPLSRSVRRRPLPASMPDAAATLSWLVDQASKPMQGAVESVVGLLTKGGTRVEPMALDELEAANAAHLTIMRAEVGSLHADLHAKHADTYAPRIGALVEAGLRVAAHDYLRALRYRPRFRRLLANRSRDVEVLVAPSAVGAAEPVTENTIGQPVMNLLPMIAGLPAISLPAALDPSGLPLGVQLVGKPNADDRLLAIAAELEERLGFRRPELPVVRRGAPSPG
jgi:Asp-tRNA(Asn)/Glu-tRNA(Gln) amidotransferase A subunit family amidase